MPWLPLHSRSIPHIHKLLLMEYFVNVSVLVNKFRSQCIKFFKEDAISSPNFCRLLTVHNVPKVGESFEPL